METLIIKDEYTLNIIAKLAKQVHSSQIEIIQQAINDYAQKLEQKNHLMSYAGILDSQEADEILAIIQENRVDKK
ncbi:MAG: hypothetical protein KAH84_10030 [Thiomargarita sp.]|nr:hypothetical protein [Thiomargarita sp.]